MAQTQPVVAGSASAVPQTTAKAQKAAKIDARSFAGMLREETLAREAQARPSATPQHLRSRKGALSQGETQDADARDGASSSSSEPAQTDPNQPVAAGLAYLAVPPVLAAATISMGDPSDPSATSGLSAPDAAVGALRQSPPASSARRHASSQLPEELEAAAFSSPLAVESAVPSASMPEASSRTGFAPEASFALSLAPLTASSRAANERPQTVPTVVLSSNTYLAPGAPPALALAAAVERSGTASQPGKPTQGDAAGADGVSPETGVSASALRRNGAWRSAQIMASGFEAIRPETPTTDPVADALAPTPPNAAYRQGQARDAARTGSQSEAAEPLQVADGQIRVSAPADVRESARFGAQESVQDSGFSRERSSGSDQSSAVRSPSDAGLAIPTGSGWVSAPAPSQQIAQAIEAAMPAAMQAGVQPDGTAAASASQPVKTIALALAPPNLGGVEIELSLASGKLDVKIRAAEPETARLLRKDDAALEKLLQSAGISLQGLTIQVSPQAAQSSHTGAQMAPNGQGFADPSGADGGRDQGGRQGGGERPADKGSDRGSTNGRASSNRRGGSLYL
jgi:hypothetical protein